MVYRFDEEWNGEVIAEMMGSSTVSYMGLKVLGKPESETSSPANSATEATTIDPLHVLLAEDNVVNQKLAMTLLTKAGHSVSLAANGVEAVSKWREGDIDLILMDVQMPEMDAQSGPLQQILDAVTHQDAVGLEHAAHNLRGTH
jgi:CheY-like chemotaxis protein